jgi:hypothetical protein
VADLTNVEAVKAYAGVRGSADDARILGLVGAISAYVAGLIGHDYEGGTITAETHSGPVSGAVVLAKPAATISAVRELGTTVDPSGYALEGDALLWRKAGTSVVGWAEGRQAIEVDYVTLSDVPSDLELAAREACAFMVKQTGWLAGGNRLGLSAQANADTGSADYFAQTLAKLPAFGAIVRLHRRVF